MAVHKLKREQVIDATISEVWDFFSVPENLTRITPQYMNFRITSEKWVHGIYAGQIITYKVSPILGIPLYWMTEITQVAYHKHFIDVQRKGPYKMWHHQHFFEAKGDRTIMTDMVHYELPYMLIGEIAHSLFIKRQLNNIFDHRYKVIEDIFNK